MVNIIPTISIITPNVNDLYITIESERLSGGIKRKKTQLHVVYKKLTLNKRHSWITSKGMKEKIPCKH